MLAVTCKFDHPNRVNQASFFVHILDGFDHVGGPLELAALSFKESLSRIRAPSLEHVAVIHCQQELQQV